jgi:hypothetical protein
LWNEHQLIAQGRIANRQRWRGFVDDVAKLLRPQERHGGHCYQASFDHGQPRKCQTDRVAAAQQHTVARHQTMILRQQFGNAVDALMRLCVGEGDAARSQKRAG